MSDLRLGKTSSKVTFADKTEPAKETKSTREMSKSNLSKQTLLMLLLHYKQQLSFESISQIIGVATDEVSRCCTNFARIFSEKKVLMEVIDAASEKQHLRVGISSEADEIQVLRAKLRLAQLRADAYEEMIRVAEQRFNIPIRKKAGAKQ